MSEERLNGQGRDERSAEYSAAEQFLTESEDTAEGMPGEETDQVEARDGSGGGAEPRRSRGDAESPLPGASQVSGVPRLSGPKPGAKPRVARTPRTGAAMSRDERDLIEANFTPEQRLLILDTWRRSGLPAAEFA